MSEIKVNKISPRSGTDVTLGDSSDTFTVPSGVGLTLTDSTLLLPTTVTATTEVKTNKISPATGVAFALGDSGDTFTVPAGATIVNSGTATGFGGGKIGQVVSTTLSTNTSTTSATFVDISGFAVSITPTATSSKILVLVNMSLSAGGLGNSCQLRMMRDSTPICINTDGAIGSSQPAATWQLKEYRDTRIANQGMNFLDSPSSTSAISYNVEWRETEGTTLYMNRMFGTSDSSSYPWTASTITAMEVLA